MLFQHFVDQVPDFGMDLVQRGLTPGRQRGVLLPSAGDDARGLLQVTRRGQVMQDGTARTGAEFLAVSAGLSDQRRAVDGSVGGFVHLDKANQEMPRQNLELRYCESILSPGMSLSTQSGPANTSLALSRTWSAN